MAHRLMVQLRCIGGIRIGGWWWSNEAGAIQ